MLSNRHTDTQTHTDTHRHTQTHTDVTLAAPARQGLKIHCLSTGGAHSRVEASITSPTSAGLILLNNLRLCSTHKHCSAFFSTAAYRPVGSKFEMVRPYYSAMRAHNLGGHAHLPSPHTLSGTPALECYCSPPAF